MPPKGSRGTKRRSAPRTFAPGGGGGAPWPDKLIGLLLILIGGLGILALMGMTALTLPAVAKTVGFDPKFVKASFPSASQATIGLNFAFILVAASVVLRIWTGILLLRGRPTGLWLLLAFGILAIVQGTDCCTGLAAVYAAARLAGWKPGT